MQADRLDAQSFGFRLPTRGSDIYEPSNKITREEDGRQQYLAYLAQRQRQSKSSPQPESYDLVSESESELESYDLVSESEDNDEDEDEYFTVQKVLRRCTVGPLRGLFLVVWEGGEETWEPAENLRGNQQFEAFLHRRRMSAAGTK
eukprot:COSAG01_NODE_9889_length_2311_cov_1.304250_1_plen_146_part_00